MLYDVTLIHVCTDHIIRVQSLHSDSDPPPLRLTTDSFSRVQGRPRLTPIQKQ